MNKYNLKKIIFSNKPVVKDEYIQTICKEKDVLDLGCIRHSAEFSVTDPNWLHGKIKAVARSVVGVDYLPKEVDKIKSMGFDVLLGDVTKPLALNAQFDVIVAGDLIEHLVSFEGFFENCSRLLKDDGVLIITTPNPFYSAQYFFTVLKGNYLLNEEHTCWIDPLAMSQLLSRFTFKIENLFFIKNGWKLQWIVSESENNQYDIMNNVWAKSTFFEKVKRKLIGLVFLLFYIPFSILNGSKSHLVRYSDYLVVVKKDIR